MKNKILLLIIAIFSFALYVGKVEAIEHVLIQIIMLLIGLMTQEDYSVVQMDFIMYLELLKE